MVWGHREGYVLQLCLFMAYIRHDAARSSRKLWVHPFPRRKPNSVLTPPFTYSLSPRVQPHLLASEWLNE